MVGLSAINVVYYGMTVTFSLAKTNGEQLDLIYRRLPLAHAELWEQSLAHHCEQGHHLLDQGDRCYHFSDFGSELITVIGQCNRVIANINAVLGKGAIKRTINLDTYQDDVNHLHAISVEANRQQGHPGLEQLWTDLNSYLHGIEILERGRDAAQPEGTVFIDLQHRRDWPLPREAYRHFTLDKTFGTCYANYPHVGRHVYEAWLSRDEDGPDDHIMPMHNIGGSSYLWFGSSSGRTNTPRKMAAVKEWFIAENIGKRLGMRWGDPHLAIGWLPVAQLETNIQLSDLAGICRVAGIKTS